jgi:branched-chain amino acid transport system permease protein
MRKQFQAFEAWVDGGIGRQRLGYILSGLIALFFLAYPLFPNASNYTKTVFISGFFFAILASSWSLLAGIAGQFSFGHMAFMGIGAYVSGLIGQYGFLAIAPEAFPVWAAIIVGTLAAGLIGLAVGALCLRLKEAYLALFTIAFSELFRIIMLTEFRVTGGNNGLRMRRLFDLGDITATRNANYYIMLVVLVLSMLLMYWLANSRVGLFLRAMREDDQAASALGVNVVRYKIFVFVLTSMIVGLAGGIFYHNVGAERITPESLEVLQMALVIAYAVIGGMESLVASAAGAFISRWLLEALREIPYPFGIEIAGATSYEPGAWRFALFGLVLVLTLRFARNGLLFPIIQWFQNTGDARQETVARRNAAGDPAEGNVEAEGASS